MSTVILTLHIKLDIQYAVRHRSSFSERCTYIFSDEFCPFYCQGFGSILDLVPLAESVIKLSAVCMNCFGEGSFTKRFGSATEVRSIVCLSHLSRYSSNAVQVHIKSNVQHYLIWLLLWKQLLWRCKIGAHFSHVKSFIQSLSTPKKLMFCLSKYLTLVSG